MKQDIHPTYNSEAHITCACGNDWFTGSTFKELKLEICSNCHPFYTGNTKQLDAQGKIEQFEKRRKKTAELVSKTKSKKPRIKKNLE